MLPELGALGKATEESARVLGPFLDLGQQLQQDPDSIDAPRLTMDLHLDKLIVC